MTEDVIDRAPPGVPMPKLTRRETVVLRELHRGLTLDEIAGRLYVSRNTVKTQVQSLYRKLGVSNRSDAVALVGSRLDAAAAHRPQRRPGLDPARGGPSRWSADGLRHDPPHRVPGTIASTGGARERIATRPHSPLPARPDPARGRDGAPSPRGEARGGAHLVSVPWTPGQADDWVPSCAALVRLAHQLQAARDVVDAIDAAIATEVAATRSRGATWSEIGAALNMTRQSVRRRFDESRQYFSV